MLAERYYIRPMENDINALGLTRDEGVKNSFLYLPEKVLPKYFSYIKEHRPPAPANEEEDEE